MTRIVVFICLFSFLSLSLKHMDHSSMFRCAYNSLGVIPGDPSYSYQVINKHHKPQYTAKDFKIHEMKTCKKSHPFFKWIGFNNLNKNFNTMDCQLASVDDFARICSSAKTDYTAFFGTDLAFKCKVPKDHLLIGINFASKFASWKTNPVQNSQMFQGVYKFRSSAEARKIVEKVRTEMLHHIKKTNLRSVDIAHALNVQPALAYYNVVSGFNTNYNTLFAKDIKKHHPEELLYELFIKVFPAGTEIIVGPFYQGTQDLKQMCSSYKISTKKDNCLFKV